MEYVSVAHQKAIAPRYRTACILVTAFAASVLVYMLLCYLIAPGEAQPGSEKWAQPIYSAVIVIGLMLVILRRVLMSRAVMGSAAQQGVQAVLMRLMTVTVITAAAAEIIAVMGLVFYFLTSDYQYSWRLGLVSLFLLAYSFPRRGEWQRAVAASAQEAK
jgi:hypothetical protein